MVIELQVGAGLVRELVLDTETTGIDPNDGHRIVEIGAVELINYMPTGRTYHQYINPERDMPDEAYKVHGLSEDFLKSFPIFAEIAADFAEFIGEAPLVIHNAAFDMRFINAEFDSVGRKQLPVNRAIDTLEIARRRYPGAPASLDALCRRFAVDASARTMHGALLDCELLADVYLHLMGGRQTDLGLSAPGMRKRKAVETPKVERTYRKFPVSDDEMAAHATFVAQMKDPIWGQ